MRSCFSQGSRSLIIQFEDSISINFRMIYIVDTDLKHNSIQMIEEKNNKNILIVIVEVSFSIFYLLS
ncbi:hypothetical protein T02_457 [Trichinella nativa]|uniref:Uncharacterized protein n=1 Tax=Trichinella nativa TaxID=6335 RepID=A0A0V1LGS1_9BILA|nr:hypothetical protein T02_457 [Trichinella nativa]